MLNKGFFVTGTDTGVGKTVVSALLMSCLQASEIPVKYFKPVQTGSETDNDTETVVQLAELKAEDFHPPVYTFKAPLSPDRAAAMENQTVTVQGIMQSYNQFSSEFLIVEGAGGLEVPLNDKEKFSDLIQAMKLPVVLVAFTKLGTINHTLLSVNRLKSLGIPLIGVVLNGPRDKGLRAVLEREGVVILFELPYAEDLKTEWEDLAEVAGDNLLPLMIGPKPVLDVTELDKKLIWHPYTQHGFSHDLPEVSHARDSEIFFKNGEKVIDAISSWWVNLHGHSHPLIAQAVAEQAHRLEHVIFAGYTHEPAVELANKLVTQVQKTVPDISKVFYSDNGSTAVEVAMKMAYQAQKQKGQKNRNRFLALNGSYHGDTLAAMSASDRNGFHKVFTPLMAPVDFIEPDDFEALIALKEKIKNYAAFIVEPMVQGASGMRMYSQEFLKSVEILCRENDVYLIADEVFTGFYRTGTFLACEHAKVKPDLICLSKGITGGFLPLSVTLATEEIFAAFSSDNLQQAFLHGHSYTANPIACAAANASFDLLMTDDCQRRIKNISRWSADRIKTMNGRSLGTIAAFDMETSTPGSYFKGNFSRVFSGLCRERGVLLRPLGKTIYTLPPYCITEAQFNQIYDVIEDILTQDLIQEIIAKDLQEPEVPPEVKTKAAIREAIKGIDTHDWMNS